MLTAVKAEQDVIAAIIALQAAKELGYQGTDDLSLDRPDPWGTEDRPQSQAPLSFSIAASSAHN